MASTAHTKTTYQERRHKLAGDGKAFFALAGIAFILDQHMQVLSQMLKARQRRSDQFLPHARRPVRATHNEDKISAQIVENAKVCASGRLKQSSEWLIAAQILT